MVATDSRPLAVLEFLVLAAYASDPREWMDWVKYVE
jgi:hypothetical protein